MKSFSTYHVNDPTTADGHSITISTTMFGTEEEIERIKKNCQETIGSGLLIVGDTIIKDTKITGG